MSITIEQTHYDPIPTGKYPAKIAEIEESDGQYGPQLKIRFELPPDEKGETKSLTGWTSRKFNSQSKLYAWTKAAFGGEPIDRSYIFNSDDLLGKKILITVVEKEGDKGVFNKIDGLSPFEEQFQESAPPPQDFDGVW